MTKDTLFLSEGDFVLKDMTLASPNGNTARLDAVYENILINESVYRPFISGQVGIKDGVGITDRLPIVGGETLTMEFVDGRGVNLLFEFVVYKMTNRSRGNSQAYAYTLHFCTRELLLSQGKRISRSYTGKTGSDIAKEIFNEIGTDTLFEVEECKNRHGIIVPRMEPLEAIAWVGSFATSVEFPLSAFAFFQTRSGFKLKTFDSLFSSDPVFDEPLIQLHTETGNHGNKLLQNIISFQIREQFDLLAAYNNGQFGGTLYAFDVTNRKFDKKTFDYEENFADTVKMDGSVFEKNKIVREHEEIHESVVKVISTRNFHISDEYAKEKGLDQDSVTLKNRQDNLLTKLAQTSEQLFTKVDLELSPNFAIEPGSVVTVSLPNSNALSDSNEDDPFLSGKFLVTNIRHEIGRSSYKMVTSVIKNSFPNKID